MMTMARGRRIAGAGPSSDAAETGSGRPLSSDDDGSYVDDSDYDSDLDRASLCSSFRSDFADSSASGSSDTDAGDESDSENASGADDWSDNSEDEEHQEEWSDDAVLSPELLDVARAFAAVKVMCMMGVPYSGQNRSSPHVIKGGPHVYDFLLECEPSYHQRPVWSHR